MCCKQSGKEIGREAITSHTQPCVSSFSDDDQNSGNLEKENFHFPWRKLPLLIFLSSAELQKPSRHLTGTRVCNLWRKVRPTSFVRSKREDFDRRLCCLLCCALTSLRRLCFEIVPPSLSPLLFPPLSLNRR